MRAGSITFPLFSQLFALALVFFSITPTRATGGLFDLFDDLFDILNPPRNSQPLKKPATACDCLDSISLPGFTGFLDVSRIVRCVKKQATGLTTSAMIGQRYQQEQGHRP